MCVRVLTKHVDVPAVQSRFSRVVERRREAVQKPVVVPAAPPEHARQVVSRAEGEDADRGTGEGLLGDWNDVFGIRMGILVSDEKTRQRRMFFFETSVRVSFFAKTREAREA